MSDPHSSRESPDSFRSDILKRFEESKKRNMFFDRPNLLSNWPSSSAFSNSHFHRPQDYDTSFSGGPSGRCVEIPIQVVKNKEVEDEKLHPDEVSMSEEVGQQDVQQFDEEGVRQVPISVKQGECSRTRKSSGEEDRKEEMVEEMAIPIQVERQKAHHSRQMRKSNPPESGLPKSMHTASMNIPINVEKSAKPIPNPKPFSNPQLSDVSKKIKSGSHITRIPINRYKKEGEPLHQPQKQMKCVKDNLLDEISAVTIEVDALSLELEKFTGEYQNKEYRYLDEMFTRCMIRLDNIDATGKEDVRKARKECLNKINEHLRVLEEKAGKNKIEKEKEDSSENLEQPKTHVSEMTIEIKPTSNVQQSIQNEALESSAMLIDESQEVSSQLGNQMVEVSDVNLENPVTNQS